jgi:hypothetical protein
VHRLWLRALHGVIVTAAAAWGALALWYAGPDPAALRAGLATLLVVAAALAIRGLGRRDPRWLGAFAALMLALLAWHATLEPRNDRQWQRDVAVLPTAEIDGDRVVLRNVRNFDYRSETDYTPRYEDLTLDLRELDSLDLFAVYWAGDAIAHIMLSFGFGDRYVTVSIETRKEEGEAYSALAGFFRQYELIYVVADERDLVRLRTTHREPPEQVYLYRLAARPENARRLFLQYLEQINRLAAQPEFYNTLTTNCTTNVLMHARALSDRFSLSWKVLLSGYFPEYLYDLGSLDRSLPFAELRARSLINEQAESAGDAPDFSQRIREGLPRPPPRAG